MYSTGLSQYIHAVNNIAEDKAKELKRVIADPGLWQEVIYWNWTITKENKRKIFPGQPEAPWGVSCVGDPVELDTTFAMN